MFGQDAAVLTAEDLRFSKADIARFFDSGAVPSRTGDGRGRVGRLAHRTAHPPQRTCPPRRRGGPRGAPRRGELDRRPVLGRVPARAPGLVLDIGLFDWVDAALLEEVVERPGALQRAVGLRRLAGLLEPVGSTAPGVYRLHPLLREHCATRRRS